MSLKERLSKVLHGASELIRENGISRVAAFSAARAVGSRSPLPLSVSGVQLRLRPSNTDLNFAKHCLVRGEFNCLRQAKPVSADFIIDAGGYIGTAAIALARMYPMAQILTLEPHPENFRLLRQNVRSFKNITPIHAALVGHDRNLSLYDRGTGDWGFTISGGPGDRGLATSAEGIKGLSIPTLLTTYGFDKVDILKIDIEGAEKEVFDTSHPWIDRVDSIFVELHDRVTTGCTESFRKAASAMVMCEPDGDKCLAFRAPA